MIRMYFSNIANKEVQYFKGLNVSNFTIKLADVLHKTGNVYDNKLFKIEEIVSNSIYRIVPLFNCELISGSNENDIILDDTCIIAHKEDFDTYFTFINDVDGDIQDYSSYGTYHSIGDNLSNAQFNHIVSLLRNSILHEDTLRINNVVEGLYGDYEFDVDDVSYLDTGIRITPETISAEPKVRLTNPVFRWSRYTLKLSVLHYTGVNILDDISPSNFKVVETLTVELSKNEWVDIPVEDLEQDYIISFDCVVEISHDKPEIHMLSGLKVFSNPGIIQKTETTDIYGQLLDADGEEYDLIDAGGKTLYFFERLVPTLTVNAVPDILEVGDNSDITVKATDEDGSLIVGEKIYFFEAYEPSINVHADNLVVSDNFVSDVTAFVQDASDGSRIVEPGKTIHFRAREENGSSSITNNTSTFNKTVSVVWVDDNGVNGNRPSGVTLHLWLGNEEVEEVSLTSANEWRHTFKDLSFTGAFTISIDPVSYYTASIAGNIITLTENNPNKTLTVVKEWDDDNDSHNVRPSSIVIILDTGTEVVLKASKGWSKTINVPTYVNKAEHTYTMTEREIENYMLYSKDVDGDTTTFTNNYFVRPPTPE